MDQPANNHESHAALKTLYPSLTEEQLGALDETWAHFVESVDRLWERIGQDPKADRFYHDLMERRREL